MTAVAPQPVPTIAPARPYPPRQGPKGSFIFKMITTTDPKVLGIMYLATSIAFFLIGGLMALMMRAELAVPGMQFLSNEQFNQLFTMHGTVMLLLFATPVVWGFGNYILPLQIGAPDVAFPRLNAFGFWVTLLGGTVMLLGFVTPGGAADFGWTMYMPLADGVHTPGIGADMWIVGVGAKIGRAHV